MLPPALLEILDARGDDGARVIGAEEREYFDALPDHAKRQMASAVAEEMITTPQHLGEILSLGLVERQVRIGHAGQLRSVSLEPGRSRGRLRCSPGIRPRRARRLT